MIPIKNFEDLKVWQSNTEFRVEHLLNNVEFNSNYELRTVTMNYELRTMKMKNEKFKTRSEYLVRTLYQTPVGEESGGTSS